MEKIDDRYIYQLALRDVNTGSYPTKDGMANGQKEILDSAECKSIKNLFIQLKTLKVNKEELLEEMLSKESVYKEEKNAILNKDLQIENDNKELTIQINSLELEIEEEYNRLLERGIPLPTINKNQKPTNDLPIQNRSFSERLRSFWKGIKKPIGAIIVIIFIEGFFAFALYDALIETKSQVQIISRVMSSAALIICLHIAEKRHKGQKGLIYGAYIIFGICLLLVLLFGSVIIEYLYPEIGNNIVPSYNLELDSSTQTNIENEKSLAAIFVEYDYFIGIFGLVIYLLIHFLDRSKNKIQTDFNVLKTNTNESNDYSTQYLIKKNDLLANLKQNLKVLQSKQNNTLKQPTELLNSILEYLESHKKSVKELKLQIAETESLINDKFIEIERFLDKYKTDFLDIFKNKPAAQFVELKWPQRDDIRTYYNI